FMHIAESSRHRGATHSRECNPLRIIASCFLAAQLVLVPISSTAREKAASAPALVSSNDPVLKAMQAELSRATTQLAKAEQPPHYLTHAVYDQEYVMVAGAYGSLLSNTAAHRRMADVTMRVGTPELDNTHGQSRGSGVTSGTLPLGNDQDAIARVLWEL